MFSRSAGLLWVPRLLHLSLTSHWRNATKPGSRAVKRSHQTAMQIATGLLIETKRGRRAIRSAIRTTWAAKLGPDAREDRIGGSGAVRIDGRIHWNWVFQNHQVVIHIVRNSRAASVIT